MQSPFKAAQELIGLNAATAIDFQAKRLQMDADALNDMAKGTDAEGKFIVQDGAVINTNAIEAVEQLLAKLKKGDVLSVALVAYDKSKDERGIDMFVSNGGDWSTLHSGLHTLACQMALAD